MRRSIYYILFLAILPLFCFSAKLKSGFVKVRVAQWNIGQLSMGKKGKTVITRQKRNEKAMAYSRLINDVRADIFCMNEFAPYFSLKDSLREDSADLTRNVLLGMYEDCRYGNRYGANCNCIAVASGTIENFMTVDYKVKKQHRYYSMGEIYIDSIKIKIVSTHLDVPPVKTERKAQIRELLKLLENEPYVILCADFNIADTSEYDAFKDKGFKMANHNFLGDIITFPYKESGYCLDNIMCKGFNVMGVDVYKTDLSDHYVIAADLIMK